MTACLCTRVCVCMHVHVHTVCVHNVCIYTVHIHAALWCCNLLSCVSCFELRFLLSAWRERKGGRGRGEGRAGGKEKGGTKKREGSAANSSFLTLPHTSNRTQLEALGSYTYHNKHSCCLLCSEHHAANTSDEYTPHALCMYPSN